MPLSRSAVPVAAHVRAVLADLGVDAVTAEDATLYSALVISVRSVAGDEVADPSSGPEVDDVVRRLSRGWFRRPTPYLPQSRFAFDDVSPTTIAVASTFVGGADKPSGAFWTSSFLPDGASAWAAVEEVTGSGGLRGLWEVYLDLDGVRVLVIDGNDTYVDLVRRFPLMRGDRLTVAWEQVATEYDAVHLTAAGLADTHGAVARHDGRTVALRGWDAECTAWLRFPGGRPEIVPRTPSRDR